MPIFEIYWDDLKAAAKKRLRDLNPDNKETLLITTIEIEDPDEDINIFDPGEDEIHD